MDLKNLLKLIDKTAKLNKTSRPYLVGGFPRDVFMKNLNNIADLDITCGDESVKILADNLLKVLPNAVMTSFPDGHSKIMYDNIKIDFSNNFRIPNIKNILIKSNIKNPTKMQEELYSRDFTINTLLMPMDLSSIIDVTGLAMNDIKQKTINTCLSPNITLYYDPKRILRIVYLSVKLNFYPSKKIINWVRNNNKIIHNVSKDYIKKRIGKAIKINPSLTKEMINLLNIQKNIPFIEGLY